MTVEMTPDELRRLTSRRKYRNVPVVVDQIRFASKAEARRYGELKLLQMACEIGGLTLQPRYLIHPGYYNPDVGWVRPVYFVADFAYIERGKERLVVEDIKGGRATETQTFRLKVKLLRNRFPDLDFRIVEA